MKIINVQQGSNEWHAIRATHLTATDIAHLMSGQTSTLELLELKSGQSTTEDLSMVPAVQQGTYFEPLIRRALGERYPALLEGKTEIANPVVESSEEPFFMASLDGFAKGIVIEIKNCFTQEAFESVQALGFDAATPKKFGYFYQVQWQLMVTGAKVGIIYFHFSPNDKVGELYPIRVERNDKVIEELKAKAYEFKAYLQGEKPWPIDPEIDIKNISLKEDLKGLARFKTLMRRQEELEAELTSLQKELKPLKEEIIKQIDDPRYKGVRAKLQDGSSVNLLHVKRKGSLDTTQLIKDLNLQDDELSKYQKADICYNKLSVD